MNFPYDYYHTIANNNGIFVIDQTVCRITQKGIIAWEGGSISQISQLVIDDSFNINLHQYLYFIATMVQSRSGCNSNQEVTCTNDDNNRRITFSIYTFKPGGNAWGSCQGNPKIYYHYNLTIDVIGEIKRIWGWNRYETELEYKEVYCEINVPLQYHFDPNLCISLWDFTTGGVTNESKNVEGRILTKSWIGGIDNQVMGNELCNITNLQAPYFNKVKGKATSRGLAGKWAIIDCGY
jgi:hypothetical protein